MPGRNMPEKNITTISRFNIISIFLFGSVGAILLMLSAIYNGANDYAIKNAIHRNFDLASARTEIAFSNIDSVLNKDKFIKSVQALSNKQSTLIAVTGKYPETIRVNNNDLKLPSDQLQSTDPNSRGGYFEQQGRIYIWNLISIEDQLYPVLSVEEFSDSGNAIMLSVFSNRLIIPSIFIVWLTVWGALVLSRLLGRLSEQGTSLEKYVTIDPLTGLANHKQADRILNNHLSKVLRKNRHLPVMLVLIDDNIQISKDYGLSFRDALIQAISYRIKDIVRAYDQIFRYRDDVFMVLLPDETLDSAALVEKRLYKQLNRQYEIYGHIIQPALVFELICYPDHIAQQDEFIDYCNHRIDQRLKVTVDQGGVATVDSLT